MTSSPKWLPRGVECWKTVIFDRSLCLKDAQSVPTTPERSFRKHWKRKSEPHKGRTASSTITGTGDYHNAPVCQAYHNPDSELAGPRQANEGRECPYGWRLEGNYPQRPPATTTRQNELAMESRAKAVLPRWVRWSGSKVPAAAGQWICQ